MNHVLDGIRAGVFGACILTLWSVLGASKALAQAPEASNLLYALTAFGVLGLGQLAYGAGLGTCMALWRACAISLLGKEEWRSALKDPRMDQRIAACILAAPLGAMMLGAIVGLAHTRVTSTFVRITFQALGLTIISIIAMLLLLAFMPLLIAPIMFVIKKNPLWQKNTHKTRQDDAWPHATRDVLILMCVGGVMAIVAGYLYATTLQVFAPRALKMALAGGLLVPILFGLMHRMHTTHKAWRFGVPSVGALATIVCFAGAWGWSSQNTDMRRMVNKESALLAMCTKQLQRFADKDKDGYATAMGGFDCNDADAQTYPGAKDVPGNGVDEDCSGKDTPPPSMEKHASRKVIALAISAAHKALQRQASKTPHPPKNIVMVLVDTLRQDHMTYAGYARETTPHIDAIANTSIVFMDAYATAPHTPRSIPCIFFSRYASHMKWKGAKYNYPKVKPENIGLFEILQDKGWTNYGMSSHFYFEKKRGMWQGFEQWDNSDARDIAGSNTDIASPRIWAKSKPLLERLGKAHKSTNKEHRKPFGVFIHLFEPHARWIGHKEHNFGKGSTPRERHINNYDSEIAYVDTYIKKITDTLKAQGLWEDTIFILTSDHGEAFHEHGNFFHGQNLYNEVIKVPLIVHVPGWKARKIQGAVSLIDIAPTLLDMNALTIPADFQGESLMQTMLGKEPVPDRPIFSELLPYTNWQEHHKMAVYKNEKIIRVLSSNTTEFYDLKHDPLEQKNLARVSSETSRVDAMRKRLDDWMNR